MTGLGSGPVRRARRAASRPLHDAALCLGGDLDADLDELGSAVGSVFGSVELVGETSPGDHLRRTGPFDVIVSAAPAVDLDRLWRAAHPHLRNGGVFVHIASRSERRDVAVWARGLSELAADRWASMVGATRSRAGVTTVVKRGTDYVLVSHHEANDILRHRRDRVTVEVLLELPAGSYEHRADVTSHDTNVEPAALLTTIDHPVQRLRHYTGSLVVANGSLVYADQVILPDSFRYYAFKPGTKRMQRSVPGFARLDAKRAATRRLEGNYYLLDSFFPGHYGHHTTETISRLWGWDEAKRRFPDLKALYTRWGGDKREETFEAETFVAYGIDPSDLVVVRKPVEVDSLVTATNMWHNHEPHFIHPDMQAIWTRLGDALADVPETPPRRVFVSRSGGDKRGTHNLSAVEDYFAAHGFDIVYPEQHSLARQAGLMREAHVVAGIAGSAMFNVMFARNLRHLIVLASDSYTARNEHLFSSLLGGRLDYFWSPADVPHPPRGWSEEAFTSSWTFDFGRHRQALDELMARLDD